jgi:hypothetical protein
MNSAMRAFSDAARELPELGDLYEVLELFGARATAHVLATVHHGALEFPIHGVVVGATRADATALPPAAAFSSARSLRSLHGSVD